MTANNMSRASRFIAASLLLSGCAGTGTLVDSPTVNLRSVEVADIGMHRQTFHLGFDVDNPNPFPLPVRAVEYRVSFENQRFVGGASEGSFTIPAKGQDDFTISVDVDLLRTASQLSALLLNQGIPNAVNYELKGSLTVDIPFTKPLPFSATGAIQLDGGRL